MHDNTFAADNTTVRSDCSAILTFGTKMKTKFSHILLALLSGLVIATSANATAGIGGATLDDVTLGGLSSGYWADKLAYSGVNPVSGNNGDSSGFASSFSSAALGTSAWTLGAKVAQTGSVSDSLTGAATDNLTFTWTNTNTTNGTWSITNTSNKNVTLDVVSAIHASNASTAFLFNDQQILAGQTLTGNWAVQWLNNGGNIPGFSNAGLFYRDVRYAAASPAPEPETYAMMLAGLGMIGFMARRRKST